MFGLSSGFGTKIAQIKSFNFSLILLSLGSLGIKYYAFNIAIF
jgi:hypothetical protein